VVLAALTPNLSGLAGLCRHRKPPFPDDWLNQKVLIFQRLIVIFEISTHPRVFCCI